jgi:hypothetical protein
MNLTADLLIKLSTLGVFFVLLKAGIKNMFNAKKVEIF